jgi:hypothetical protein
MVDSQRMNHIEIEAPGLGHGECVDSEAPSLGHSFTVVPNTHWDWNLCQGNKVLEVTLSGFCLIYHCTGEKYISCLFSHVDMDFTSHNIVVPSSYVIACVVVFGQENLQKFRLIRPGNNHTVNCHVLFNILKHVLNFFWFNIYFFWGFYLW